MRHVHAMARPWGSNSGSNANSSWSSGAARRRHARVSVAASAQTDSVPGDGAAIEITPLVHSSVQIAYRGTVVQVDPWSYADLSLAKPADLILITDDVGHHLDVKAIERCASRRSDRHRGERQGAGARRHRAAQRPVHDGGRHPRESIAAYDIIQGPPAHPKGEANGYVHDHWRQAAVLRRPSPSAWRR
jgi:hypothetical protein